jgi:hypothetical protein
MTKGSVPLIFGEPGDDDAAIRLDELACVLVHFPERNVQEHGESGAQQGR